jgi:serine/threonine protein kinase
MTRPEKLADLTPSAWRSLQSVLDRFETACRDGETVDLAAFLPPPGDRGRRLTLRELIRSDLAIRWRRGHGPFLEEYLDRFPELAADAPLWPPLLLEEYQARRRHGDRPALSDYQRRFPAAYGELERLLQEQETAASSSTIVPAAATVPPVENRSAAPPSSLPGPLGMAQRDTVLPVGGGYKLLERLGSGQFGEVWRAEAPGGVEVAIKIVFRSLEHADAQRELEALQVVKRLHHPFLVQVQAFWSLQDRLLIAMELADSSLRRRLKECKGQGLPGVPLAELLIYTREAAEALDFLHERRVLHRDVKPDNILLMHRHAKLADLGLARLLEEQRSFAATTCGSPPYMAPEVWQGHASAQSDQYSLAASYVELRLGRMLFADTNWVQVMLAHQQTQPDLSGLEELERAVLDRALAKDPAKRFPSCLDFVNALQRSPEASSDGREQAAVAPAALADTARSKRPSDVTTRERLPAAATGAMDVPGDSAGLASMPLPVRDTEPSARPRPPAPPGQSWRGRPEPGRARPLVWIALCLVSLLVGGGLLYLLTRPPRPTGPQPVLPAGWARETDAEVTMVDEKPYWSRIYHELRNDRHTHVVFRLLVPTREGMLPFYILETKVSNRMFGQFAAETQFADVEWKRGGLWPGHQDTGIDGDGKYEDCPVYRVPWDGAYRFALWLGGELPAAKQWDWASDFYRDPRPVGPFSGPPEEGGPKEFALLKSGPLPVGTATRDRCQYSGCKDMASNGFEWTCSVYKLGENNLPDESENVLSVADDQVRVSLRGGPYYLDRPFTFDARYQGIDTLRRSARGDSLKAVSFRVVLPVPPLPLNERP